MYSSRICDRRLESLSRKVGFRIERHTARQIANANSHFKDLYDFDQQLPKRKLNEQEALWIRNERLCCQWDARYFFENYARIVDNQGYLVPFKLNAAQEIKFSIWAEFEEAGRGIEMMSNKARQLGVSTLDEIAVAHRSQFHTYVNAVIASSDPGKTVKMAKMIEVCIENEPWFLSPRITKFTRSENNWQIEFGDLNSAITAQHGAQFTGIARGTTPTICHLSECSEYEDAEELIDRSLLPAAHPSPRLFLDFESTSMGLHNWWHNTWEYSKENWASGRARLCPVFLPWYTGEIWPDPGWLVSHPVPFDWQPETLTISHAERAKRYVHATEILKRHFGAGWEMSREQMWFWEVTRAEYHAKGNLSGFLQEHPADDIECFQSTNISVFDHEVIELYSNNIQEPEGIFGFQASESLIPLRMQPQASEIDPNLPPIEILSRWNKMQSPRRYTLVPLKRTNLMAPEAMLGKLFVWEFPQEGEKYCNGVDTSDGVGKDRSVCEVLKAGDLTRNDFQSAEFASPYINSIDLAPICDAIGTLYSVTSGDRLVQCGQSIETKFNGEATQHELRKMGWTSFYPWVRFDQRKVQPSRATRMGVFTVAWFRNMMLDYVVKLIRDGLIDINSRGFVAEMKDLEADWDKQSFRSCFVPETKVVTRDSRISIADVFPFMEVLTHRGTMEQVSRCLRYDYDGEMLRIKVAGLPDPIVCTPDHKVWVRPRIKKYLQRYAVRGEFPPEWREAKDIKRLDWVGTPKRQGLRKSKFSSEMLYAIGFWLAEGNIVHSKRKGDAGIEFTNTDPEKLMRVLATLCSKFPHNKVRVGNGTRTKVIPSRYYLSSRKRQANWKQCHTMIFYNQESLRMFSNMGRKAWEKSIPTDIYNCCGLLPLVAGFIDGDGSQRKNVEHDVSVYTTSETLAWQLRQIMLDNGVWCTLRRASAPKGNRRQSWVINVRADYARRILNCKLRVHHTRLRHRVIEDAGFFYSPVASIETMHYKGFVYDLSVEGEHSYTANNISVHNCYGGHDDRVMALGFSWIYLHILEIKLHRLLHDQRAELRSQQEHPDSEAPRYMPGLQAMDNHGNSPYSRYLEEEVDSGGLLE